MTFEPRLGIVPYLNVLPLIFGLEDSFPPHLWRRATPRDLATQMARGSLDVAILSTIEGIARGYRLVPGAMIGCRGPVRSVALYSKVPIDKIRSIVLDRASLSSSALLQIIARQHLRITPEYVTSSHPFTPNHDWHHDPHDAFMAIGDTALAWERVFPHRIDLGRAWLEMTGLPFVFAGWWLRDGVCLTEAQIREFAHARSRGTNAVNSIVDGLSEEQVLVHGGRESVRHYLRHAIQYELNEEAIRGLEHFRELLLAGGWLPRNTPDLRMAVPAHSGVVGI